MAEQNSEGNLIIKVSTGLGAIPLSGAEIYVAPYTEGQNNNVIFTLRTNEDGLTDEINLSAPAKSLSLSPNESVTPYSEYIVTVKKDGYRSAELIGLPIFDGITSIQNVYLVPLTEDEILLGNDPIKVYYEDRGYTNLIKDTNTFE